jgi:hypothetical protein
MGHPFARGMAHYGCGEIRYSALASNGGVVGVQCFKVGYGWKGEVYRATPVFAHYNAQHSYSCVMGKASVSGLLQGCHLQIMFVHVHSLYRLLHP